MRGHGAVRAEHASPDRGERGGEEAGGAEDEEHEDGHGGLREARQVRPLPRPVLTLSPCSLYERLQLDMGEKFHFLSENPGHAPSTIGNLHKVTRSHANIP